jgi:hypothetical protein
LGSSITRPLRRAPLLACVLAACIVGFSAASTAADEGQEWLYVEFNGGGVGHADNATGSGGSADLNASWTFLYKLPAQTSGKRLFINCQSSACDGHDYPYAVKGSGTGSISGSNNPGANCTTRISASLQSIGAINGLTYFLSKKKFRVQTISPMEAGTTLGDPTGRCAIYGGVFPDGSGTATSRTLTQSALVGHRGVVYSSDVHGSSSVPAKGTIDTPQNVRWSGFLKVKLGGCEPTLENLKRCFPLRRRHR